MAAKVRVVDKTTGHTNTGRKGGDGHGAGKGKMEEGSAQGLPVGSRITEYLVRGR